MVKDYVIAKRLKELCPKGYLTSDQNFLLLQEYAQDKENGVLPEDSEARTLLILGNSKLILHVLKVHFDIYATIDSEEFSVGQVALVRAVDRFKDFSNGNAKFATYASESIYHEICKYYKYLREKRLLPSQQTFLEDCVNEDINYDRRLQFIDIICDDTDFVQDIHDKLLVNDITQNIKYLTHQEAFSIVNIFGLFGNVPKTNGEIAKMLNVSHSHVTRSVNMGLRKLKILVSQDKDLLPEEKKIKQKMLTRGPINNIVNEFSSQAII